MYCELEGNMLRASLYEGVPDDERIRAWAW
jgi:hypothetical protein